MGRREHIHSLLDTAYALIAGAGGYGLVKRATHKETGLAVAIKILKLPDKLTQAGSRDNGKSSAVGKASSSQVGLLIFASCPSAYSAHGCSIAGY